MSGNKRSPSSVAEPPSPPILTRRPLSLSSMPSLTFDNNNNNENNDPYTVNDYHERRANTPISKNELYKIIDRRRVVNHAVDDLFREFMRDIEDEYELIDMSGSSQERNQSNIKLGKFGKIYLIKMNESPKPKYIMKKVNINSYPYANFQDVHVEVENVKYINQYMSDQFMIKHIIFQYGNSYYFISKYLDTYITFYDYLRTLWTNQNRNRKNRVISSILEKINAAYDEMRTHGIIHNDAHVENIKIDPETGHIKFLDYGICSILGRRERFSRIKRSESLSNVNRIKNGMIEEERMSRVESRKMDLQKGIEYHYRIITQDLFDQIWNESKQKLLGSIILILVNGRPNGKNTITYDTIMDMFQSIGLNDVNIRGSDRSHINGHFRKENGVVERMIQNRVRQIEERIMEKEKNRSRPSVGSKMMIQRIS